MWLVPMILLVPRPESNEGYCIGLLRCRSFLANAIERWIYQKQEIRSDASHSHSGEPLDRLKSTGETSVSNIKVAASEGSQNEFGERLYCDRSQLHTLTPAKSFLC